MNARDKWLASLHSDHTRDYYREVFDFFWLFAEQRYSPVGLDALADHRRAEVRRGSLDRAHCERIVSEWVDELKDTDLDASSATTYRRVVSSFFRYLLPQKRGRLR
jgi:hypothetical protein